MPASYDILSSVVYKMYKFYMHERYAIKDYLNSRHLDENICNSFGVGYGSSSSKTLKFLELNNITKEVLVEAGIFLSKDQTIYNLFEDRVIFTLWDPFGNYAGFSGRSYKKEQENSPKYINSSSSLVFQKSLLLYNLHRALPFIKSLKYVILVEGMMDVIRLWQYGVKNAVAPCGTSLTEEQCKLLKLFTENCVIIYDDDEGGRGSLPKVLALLENEKINTYPLTLSGAKDPDDFILKYGIQPLASALPSF